MEKLPISVITIARNIEVTLSDTLDSIQKNHPAEMIVVDGNSRDKTIEIAQKYTNMVYSDGGRGMGYASQLGTEKASQEFVAYIDGDVILPDGALAIMLAELRNSDYIAISAQQFAPPGRLTYWERAADERGKISKARRSEGYLSTLACIFRRETILKYKFDMVEKHLHDIDLEMRIRKDGNQFGISSARVYHLHPFSFKGFVRYRYFEGQVAVRYINKWGPFHIRFWPFLYSIYWVGFSIISGKFHLLPYLIVDDVVQTVGMGKGFFELVVSLLKGKKQNA